MGIAARRAINIGKGAPICCACAGEVLSVTQPDIAVVGGNLLGWLLVWRPRLSYV